MTALLRSIRTALPGAFFGALWAAGALLSRNPVEVGKWTLVVLVLASVRWAWLKRRSPALAVATATPGVPAVVTEGLIGYEACPPILTEDGVSELLDPAFVRKGKGRAITEKVLGRKLGLNKGARGKADVI